MKRKVTFSDDGLPEFFTVEEMGNYLRISRSGAYALLHTEGFPYIQIGKRFVIPKADLMQWLDKRRGNDSQCG